MKPKNFNGEDSKNVMLEMENSFAQTCVVLEDLGVSNPRSLTVYEFYNWIKYLKEKHKPKNEQL